MGRSSPSEPDIRKAVVEKFTTSARLDVSNSLTTIGFIEVRATLPSVALRAMEGRQSGLRRAYHSESGGYFDIPCSRAF